MWALCAHVRLSNLSELRGLTVGPLTDVVASPVIKSCQIAAAYDFFIVRLFSWNASPGVRRHIMECVGPSRDQYSLVCNSKHIFDRPHPGFEVQFLRWRCLACAFGIVLRYRLAPVIQWALAFGCSDFILVDQLTT